MTVATKNGSATDTDTRITDLETKVAQLIWLHAELNGRFTAVANVLAELYAQQLQPQMRQAILTQLFGR